jgi:uncharacterized protein (DUF1697 family)
MGLIKFVALIRNINVGQTNFPSRSQLVQAFLSAGTQNAVSFRSNGTVIFELDPAADLHAFQQRVADNLLRTSHFSEAIMIRALESIRAIVQQNPFSCIPGDGYTHQYMSFFDCEDVPEGLYPLESPKKDCLIFGGTIGEAFSLAREFNGKSGYPTPVLEKVLKTPVTTRSWTTMQRLVEKF